MTRRYKSYFMKSWIINRCVPETPSFLLYTHQEEKAERALQWLRGEEADVSAEMATIHGNIRRMREQGADCRRVLVPQLVRPLLLTCGLMFFHRFVLNCNLAPKKLSDELSIWVCLYISVIRKPNHSNVSVLK